MVRVNVSLTLFREASSSFWVEAETMVLAKESTVAQMLTDNNEFLRAAPPRKV